MQLTTTPQARARHKDWVRTAVLLAMGVYLTFLLISGNLSNYMNSHFHWLVGVAAGLFYFLGGWNLLVVWRGSPEPHTLDDNLNISHEGHTHTNVSWWAIGIASLPLVFALLVPSRPLGADAVHRISFSPVGVASAASAARSPLDRNILDWLREFNRIDNPAAFNGVPARVIGFIYREPHMSDDEFMVARFTISCCVADAFAIGLPVRMEGAAAYSTGAWIEVEGTFQAGTFDDRAIPILHPTRIELTDVPARPYLYP
jgi:uncharacterized repeat protein (TIGR03943 family)